MWWKLLLRGWKKVTNLKRKCQMGAGRKKEHIVVEKMMMAHSNLEYVLVKTFCPNKSDDKFINYRQQTITFHWNQNEIKSHFGGLEWYTSRNAHQIWVEWAVWTRWQILNGSQFFFHFNEKWLSVDNISWIHYQFCLDKKNLLIHLWDCCALWIELVYR